MERASIVDHLFALVPGSAPVRDRATIAALERAGVVASRGGDTATLTVEGWEAVNRLRDARAQGTAIDEIILSASGAYAIVPIDTAALI
jgi:hypothetical protein